MGCKGKSIKIWNGKRKQRSVIEHIDLMNEEELRNIVQFACTAASLSTRKHGGINSVPDEAEVLAKIRETGQA